MNIRLVRNVFQFTRRVYFSFRKFQYYFRCNSFGKGSYVSSNVHLRKCYIGAYSHIGPNSVLNRAIIGPYCSFASDVMVGGEEHAYWEVSTSDKLTDKGITENDTVFGYDVWVGAQCYIRQGVKIGNGVVIGSNSFVNKDIPDYAIVAGSPAKIIKYRFDRETIDVINASKYWLYEPKRAKERIRKINIQK